MGYFRIIILCIFLQYNFDDIRGFPDAQSENIIPTAIPQPEFLCNPPIKQCNADNTIYSVDGTCNNLKYPYIGSAQLPFSRMSPAEYSDGFCAIRKASDGSDLPLARLIRTTVLLENEVYSNSINMLCAGFGQFLTHDITFQSPIGATDPSVTCCKNNQPDPNMPLDKCLPLIIPADDKFYQPLQVTCIQQTRTTNTQMKGCNMTPCAPINGATAYLDLSILYTTRDDTLDQIRTHQGGLLKTMNNELEYSYPALVFGSSCPKGGITRQRNGSCFQGDPRPNQNPEMSTMLILFTRTHNYLARGLQNINPFWTDDQLFNIARRILIAMYQIILYKEQVPSIIGPILTSFYNLNLAENGYINGYNEEVDPRTTVEYESVAGRAQHSMIRGIVPYVDENDQLTQYQLHDKFFNQEFILNKKTFLHLIAAYGQNEAEDQDQYYTNEVTNHQFILGNDKFGTDLPATDINRGRDHGVSTINKAREVCGLPIYQSFDDMRNFLRDPDAVEQLKWLYQSVNDADLYVIGQLEKPVPGGLLGPTLACITGESFQRWKFGDRLYAEFPSAGFTEDQLVSLRQTTFAEILCITNPGLEYVYQHSLSIPSEENQKIRCSDVPVINLELWRIPPSAPSGSSPPAPLGSCPPC